MAPPYTKMLDSDCAKKTQRMSRETFQICQSVQRTRGNIHSPQVEQPIFSHLSTGSSLYRDTVK